MEATFADEQDQRAAQRLSYEAGRDEPPLCVKLDGCVAKTDTSLEGVLALLGSKPLLLPAMLRWLIKGRAYFRSQVALHAPLNIDTLPLNEDIRKYLQAEKRQGRRIYLVAASHELIAKKIARRVGLFDGVINSEKPADRRAELLSERFGTDGFDYIGNSAAELPVFRGARHAYYAGQCWWLRIRLALGAGPELRPVPKLTAERPADWLVTLARAGRCRQWLKNLLLLLPLFLSCRLADLHALVRVVMGMASFCLAASSAYLINDLLDLGGDRLHPTKRNRPLASGALSIATGSNLAVGLVAGAGVIGAMLGREFAALLIMYWLCTLGYSLYLKRMLLVDTLVLAGLYAVRVVAGALAARVELSFWLSAFCLFFFLSLALLKRYIELREIGSGLDLSERRRAYVPCDLPQIQALGIASGFSATLVLLLYLDDPRARSLYAHPQILAGLFFVVVYWLGRAWLLAGRGLIRDDPVNFASRDLVSIAAAAVCAAVLWAAHG